MPLTSTLIPGTLEIDHQRGVIYFHSSLDGVTRLRICCLPAPIPPLCDHFLDITHMHGASWSTQPPTK